MEVAVNGFNGVFIYVAKNRGIEGCLPHGGDNVHERAPVHVLEGHTRKACLHPRLRYKYDAVVETDDKNRRLNRKSLGEYQEDMEPAK